MNEFGKQAMTTSSRGSANTSNQLTLKQAKANSEIVCTETAKTTTANGQIELHSINLAMNKRANAQFNESERATTNRNPTITP